MEQEHQHARAIADPQNSPLPIKIDEEMMIYPTGEKPILKDPYFTFSEMFKHQQWIKLFAIGYSFRDIPVNVAILENLEKVKDSTLIVINPNAENEIRNLGPLAKKYNDRIIRMPNKFTGDDAFHAKLDYAIRVDTWHRYRDRIWADFKERVTS